MTMKRAILEMGMGNDLHGEDYTKAAERAIKDALHHSSLSFIRTLNINKNQLFVNVTIGVQNLKMWKRKDWNNYFQWELSQ